MTSRDCGARRHIPRATYHQVRSIKTEWHATFGYWISLSRPPPTSTHPSDNGRQIDGHVVCFYDIDQLIGLAILSKFWNQFEGSFYRKNHCCCYVWFLEFSASSSEEHEPLGTAPASLLGLAAFVFLIVVTLRQSIIARINITAAFSG